MPSTSSFSPFIVCGVGGRLVTLVFVGLGWNLISPDVCEIIGLQSLSERTPGNPASESQKKEKLAIEMNENLSPHPGLKERLETTYEAAGGRKVNIISHSMGGLSVSCSISLHYDVFVKYVKKWITNASPFQGNYAAFDCKNCICVSGAPGFINDSLLTGLQFVYQAIRNASVAVIQFISTWASGCNRIQDWPYTRMELLLIKCGGEKIVLEEEQKPPDCIEELQFNSCNMFRQCKTPRSAVKRGPPQSKPDETIVIAHMNGNHYIKAALREVAVMESVTLPSTVSYDNSGTLDALVLLSGTVEKTDRTDMRNATC
ncbi:phospholipase A(1) LCAT3-like protein [Tanacetum coccineum]